MASSSNDTATTVTPLSTTIPTVTMPDLSAMYSIAAEGMDFQNQISQAQLELAEKRQEIAEDLYNKSLLFRPVEQKVFSAARAGYDPNFFAARERNAVIQANKGAADAAMKNAAQRGISASSPSAYSAAQGISAQIGKKAGETSEAAREKTAQQNINAKAQAVGLGANIPSESISGYNSAANIASQSGSVAAAAAQQVVNQMGFEAQLNLQQQQIAAASAYNKAQLDLQQQGLQQQISQNNASNAWAMEKSDAQTESAMWGAIPIVGPVIGAASGGSYICTEILHQGLVDLGTYEASCRFDESLSRDTVNGYRIWAFTVANKMRSSRVLTRIAMPFALAYMNYAAAVVLNESRPIFGRIVFYVGAPICNLIGRIMRSW